MKKPFFPALVAALLTALAAFILSGCVAPGVESVVGMAVRHGERMSEAAHEFTPEEEYAIGRAVSARLIAKYGAVNDQAANSYLNQLGQALAMKGARPMPGGYHFLLLKSPEVNAFAAPGGFIFVTTGMVGLVSDESELAAVLAHEISHVQNRDAIAAIKTSRTTSATTGLVTDAAGSYAPVPGAGYLNMFSGAIDDVINSLVVKGYSRGQEYAADAGAKSILGAAGYDPASLEIVLRAMSKRVAPGSAGFGSTHPSAEDRLAKIGAANAASAASPANAPAQKDTGVRAERFGAAMGRYGAR